MSRDHTVSGRRQSPQETEYLAPETLIEISHREHVDGISFTYNEPTLWVEYAERVMTLAKEAGLATNWVTNGYLTSETLDSVGQWLDAFRVDIKGFSETTYRRIGGITDYREILETIKRAKRRWGMHVELVTNIIPGVNDDRAELTNLARWIVRELGPDTPWHLTRFVPHHQWTGYPNHTRRDPRGHLSDGPTGRDQLPLSRQRIRPSPYEYLLSGVSRAPDRSAGTAEILMMMPGESRARNAALPCRDGSKKGPDRFRGQARYMKKPFSPMENGFLVGQVHSTASITRIGQAPPSLLREEWRGRGSPA